MGGSAHIIIGNVDEESWVVVAPKRGFIGRLFGGAKSSEIIRTSMGDSILVDIPSTGLSKKLHDAFTQYLNLKLSKPNQATLAIFDYLSVARTEVYIRGEEKNNSCEYYTQITFSGCAGMGEVSAEICSHWAAIWVQECLELFIKPTLLEYGFVVDERLAVTADNHRFLHLDIDGYQCYASVWADGSMDLDGSFYEDLNENADEFNDRLAKDYASRIQSAICECQLCKDIR